MWIPAIAAGVAGGGVGTVVALRAHAPAPLAVAAGAAGFGIAAGTAFAIRAIVDAHRGADAVIPAGTEVPAGQRDDLTWAAIERSMHYRDDDRLLSERADDERRADTVWPHGQAIAAALDHAELDGDFGDARRLIDGLNRFWSRDSYAAWIDSSPSMHLWDDNAWIGLDLIQAFRQTGERRYLDQAERLFPFMLRGLHPDGGLHWQEGNPRPSRNTCSNAPAVEYALHLYELTGNDRYLTFARNLDGFLQSTLRTPDGLYLDNVSDDGRLDTRIFSYNQGTPIGADVLWYRITGDHRYIERAQQTADAALRYLGAEDRLWHQSPAFNAIFFRNLLQLDAIAPDPSYRATLNAYLERGWREARDPETGLFTRGGVGSFEHERPDSLLDTSGWAQLYALVQWPADRIELVS